MKKILIMCLAFIANTAISRTVEVDVHGMTCAFCVDSLNRKFSKFETVSKVDISLKNNKIRLVTNETEPTIKAIKQAVLDAGFTPVSVKIIDTK